MPKKHRRLTFSKYLSCTAIVLFLAVLLVSASACSQKEDVAEETSPPTLTASPTASPTALATPTPTAAPTATQPPAVSNTPEPTPNVSFPPFETDSAGTYTFPQVLPDKSTAMTGDPVYFKILTSKNVNSVRTIIDGESGREYKSYEKEGDFRIWRTKIHFTVGGSRKVQFECAMASGGTATIPSSPVKIDVTFDYTAKSTSKTISKGKTVTFTLSTPDTIDTIYALVDDVNQDIAYTEPDSDEGGVRVWKIRITFFGLGNRNVKFEAHDGSRLKATFPESGIPILVQESV